MLYVWKHRFAHALPNSSVYSFSYSYSIKQWERKGKKENRRKEARVLHALAVRVHTRESKLSPFIGQPGKGGRAAAVKRKGCMWSAREREEGGRGAPSYFTVITVTCYRARSLRHAINRRLPLLWWWGDRRGCKRQMNTRGGYCGTSTRYRASAFLLTIRNGTIATSFPILCAWIFPIFFAFFLP